MLIKYPVGTKVSLMPAKCVTNFMGLNAQIWDKQIRLHDNVHVVSDYIYNADNSLRGYYFKSSSYYWNAEYVIALDEDLQQWDMEMYNGN